MISGFFFCINSFPSQLKAQAVAKPCHISKTLPRFGLKLSTTENAPRFMLRHVKMVLPRLQFLARADEILLWIVTGSTTSSRMLSA